MSSPVTSSPFVSDPNPKNGVANMWIIKHISSIYRLWPHSKSKRKDYFNDVYSCNETLNSHSAGCDKRFSLFTRNTPRQPNRIKPSKPRQWSIRHKKLFFSDKSRQQKPCLFDDLDFNLCRDFYPAATLSAAPPIKGIPESRKHARKLRPFVEAKYSNVYVQLENGDWEFSHCNASGQVVAVYHIKKHLI
ncbi:hypothetical protein BATDEDRAFT_87748 [Batrachochytrium dendrobatidis JAM81]|uniref:Uncharacterized protein n=2 Tax=Batrachochytrium dendrobatidis TaxID=109871 RepID=F4NZI5_BATDJ|nr:uncharacterized protein BATDEDRAFT_87748 [Batrachochytrium dendrobatidis JAM81]EGF81448.1 hypothetical protein BATDEDRAFT_87748 [Batrachochytrium dendrobatidis JAM81]KAJ8329835.1 hypothetical protein O5D80_002028 [Batrachochytrium dendrobatidis]KAK5669903.1 hypothetical protein QVD99_004277 [Batrachochytrium dendrobatidis]OAJ38464.1 hypothetical protein BDEG_22388 [Batrachochytrium dendrobatidis JEL423]|eukprot:XP_006678206.1 hypothetical protein BATDEDRAFT_87748 [Batrachochytrium dendrobatidis JAM81]